AAMGLDGFKTTHPIVQEIKTVDETNQAFDTITYQKGEAVISMLEAFAGENVWRDGLRAYMRDHKFGNTRSKDLW
ncbi:MAG: M1 family aminopeptidase, partial [Novosphingobium sp.]